MTNLWIDLETYSTVPINSGTHAYAEQAEVMLFAWAIDEGPVSVWDCTRNTKAVVRVPADLLDALENPEVLIYAHNSHFDRTILRHAAPCKAAKAAAETTSRWRDTMVKAMTHSLPGSLGDLCDILKVPTDKAKDKAGKQLIHLFCKPRATGAVARATRETHPERWAEFVKYAALDIDAMRAIDAKLPTWNFQGAELDLWHLDQCINDRGVCVDLDLVGSAITAVDRAQKGLAKRTQELTDGAVQAATQRDAMLRHLTEAFGVDLPDMQAATLQRRVDDPNLPQPVRELLAVRLQASTTSTAKYKKLKAATSADGRLRGTLQFNGASRTGRWAGRLFQPQNLPRPMLLQPQIQAGIEALKAECADLVFDNVMELTSSTLRGCLVAAPAKKLVVADLSNIEGRMLAWLAGENWKLKAFADYDAGIGHDLYALAYAKTFHTTPEAVMWNKENGDGNMRQIGKVLELAMGYEGGVGAFITFAAAYGIDLAEMAAKAIIPEEYTAEARQSYAWHKLNKRPTHGLPEHVWLACDAIKRMWRAAHPHVAALWRALGDACINATQQPGRTLTCRALKIRRDGAWLRIRLPSGRFLCYPSPALDDEGKLTYMGVNQYSRKWSRLHTYGGKLVENVTQAAARDVLAASMPAIERSGYEIVLSVHDELLTETPDTDEYSSDHLAALMATAPEWATGLPLAAAGFEAYRYRKD